MSGLIWSLGLPIFVVIFLAGLGVSLVWDWINNRKQKNE